MTCARAADLPACDADNGGLKLPPGFCALVAANDLGSARHMAVAPNGDLYVALQGMGGVAALHDSKGDGHFDVKEIIGEGSSTGVALHNGYLSVAKTSEAVRFPSYGQKAQPQMHSYQINADRISA